MMKLRIKLLKEKLKKIMNELYEIRMEMREFERRK